MNDLLSKFLVSLLTGLIGWIFGYSVARVRNHLERIDNKRK